MTTNESTLYLERGDFDTWAELSILLGKLGPDHVDAELRRLGIDPRSFEAESLVIGERMRREHARGQSELHQRYAELAARWIGVVDVSTGLAALLPRLRRAVGTGFDTVDAGPLDASAPSVLPFTATPAQPRAPVVPELGGPGRAGEEPFERGDTIGADIGLDDTLPFVKAGPAPLPFDRYVAWLSRDPDRDPSAVEVLEQAGLSTPQAQRNALIYWRRRLARDGVLRARVATLVSRRLRGES